MPEKGMKTLLEQVVDQVTRAKRNRVFREFGMICDDSVKLPSSGFGPSNSSPLSRPHVASTS